jgi:integrase
MPLPYLRKKNAGWQVQIRLPVTLDPDLRLSPIRLTIPAMPAIEARRKAVSVVSAVQTAIAEVERLNEHTPMPPKASRDATMERINRVLPTLLGLDALAAPTATTDSRLIEGTFDVLAQIGNDRAMGEGLFADPRIRHEQVYAAALQVPQIASAATAHSSRAPGVPTEESANPIDDLLAQPDRIAELTAALRTMHSIGVAPTNDGPLFSAVLKTQIAEVIKSKGPKSELVGIYAKVGTEFIAIVGDRPIGSYRRADLQEYANEIAWLPPTASSSKGYRHENVKSHIARNKKAKGRGLAAKTINDGRISHLKAIIGRGCEDNDQHNRVANTRIRVPDRASPPVKHKAPEPLALSRVLNIAVDTEGLTTPLMLVLGTLTGRRVSLLATLRREALVRWHDVYVIEVETHRYENGVWIRVPFKTDESRECIVVPNALVEAGIVAWAQEAPGPMFPEFMACADPGDAAQKRVNRVIQKIIDGHGLPRFTYHGLRAGRIDDALDNHIAPHLVQHQVGHKADSVHGRYRSLTPKQASLIASQPLPEGVDWSCLSRINFSAPQTPTRKRRTSAQLKIVRERRRRSK